MPDNSKSIDILIRTRAELAGARAVEEQLERDIGKAKALGNTHEDLSRKLETVKGNITAATTANRELGEAEEDAGKHAGHAGNAHREMHRAMHQITEEAPLMGAALRAAVSPMGAVLGIALGALRSTAEHIKELEKTLSFTGEWESFKALVEGSKEALESAALEAEAYARGLEHIGTAAATATESSENFLKLHQAQVGAQDRLLDAQKKLELARAGTIKDPVARAEKELEIENRYGEARRRRADEEGKFQLAEQNRRLANEQVSQFTIERDLKKAREHKEGLGTAESVTGKIDVEKKRLEQTEELMAELQKRHDEIENIPWVMRSTPHQIEMNIVTEALEKSDSTRFRQREFIHRLEQDKPGKLNDIRAAEEDVKRLEDAQRASMERAQSIRKSLPTQGSVFDVERKGRTDESLLDRATKVTQTPIGQAAFGDVSGAIDTAKALEQHKRVSEESKEQLRDVASKIAGHQVSLQEAVKMMDWAATNIANFGTEVLRLAGAMEGIAAALPTIKRRLSFVEQQTQDIDSRSRAARAQ